MAVVAGSGQVAHTAVGAGADLLVVLNAGLYRTLGCGSLASFLPYGNANEQTVELLTRHVLPAGRADPGRRRASSAPTRHRPRPAPRAAAGARAFAG